MPKLPNPPGVPQLVALGVRATERQILPAGNVIWRLYFQGGPHPSAWHDFRTYGPTAGRFDHHLDSPSAQSCGILYGATAGPVCFAEVFQDTRTIDRTRRAPWLVAFELASDVQLLDLSSNWPTRADASQAINSGSRKRARRWSQQIYEAFADIEGIFYPSSMCKNEPAVALYERASNAIPQTPVFHRALADPALLTSLQNVAFDLGYCLL